MSKIQISELNSHQSLIDLDLRESQYLKIIGGDTHEIRFSGGSSFDFVVEYDGHPSYGALTVMAYEVAKFPGELSRGHVIRNLEHRHPELDIKDAYLDFHD